MDEVGIPILVTMPKESFDLCSKIQEPIIYNWCYNNGCLHEAKYNDDLVHWTHGILMECYIFMTDVLLDLEWYIAIWTHWLGVRVSVVQVCCINHKGISKHWWGFWTLSPTQPRNHKGHNLFRSLKWTHQCARFKWHSRSLTEYCVEQTLYESQRCDDGVEVEHVRNNHPKRH